MTTPDDQPSENCALCGRPREAAGRLIVGAKGAICLDCVALCDEIVAEEEAAPHQTLRAMPERLQDMLAGSNDLPNASAAGAVDLMAHVAELQTDLEGL